MKQTWMKMKQAVRMKLFFAITKILFCFAGQQYAFKKIMEDKKGEGFVDTLVKILTAVVIGALILGALYLMFKDTLLPMVQQKLIELFNYQG